MASGGHDESHDNLDLTEINAEIEKLDLSSESEQTDSLIWEECKADLEYDDIAEESNLNDFEGFEPITSTPIKSAHSSTAPTRSKVKESPKGTRSAPVSPVLVRNPLKIQQRIQSWEKLISTETKKHSVTGTRPKLKSSPKGRTCTRGAAKRGLTSPLTAAGDFQKRRRLKFSPSKSSGIAQKKKKLKSKPKIPPITVTMDQADIPRAGRLNPRTRRANGVGDTVESLGFPELNTAGISPAGKIEVEVLLELRESIVADANLVLKPGGNMRVAKELIDSYIEEIENSLINFKKEAADIADGNANGTVICKELIKLQAECKSLLRYCKGQIAGEPAAGAAAAVADQVRIERLHFPTFDGTGNYKNWKMGFVTLIPHAHREEVKKSHLLEALKGKAKGYINSVITPESTYDQIMVKLEERYNDPLVVNYNLLDRMFNSPDMAKPQSTQEHWDIAVGDINAILASGMELSEVLVYYKLHKFPPETVKKVKVLHKIQYPGRPSIKLAEAIKLMNEVTADEVELTKDSVAIEQTMQGLTMTAVPKVSPASAPAQPLNNLPPNTSKKQNGGKKSNRYKKKGTTNYYIDYCRYCETEDHYGGNCPNFTTNKSRRQALADNDRCQECAVKYEEGITHHCKESIKCDKCHRTHYTYLCPKSTPSNK